MPCPPTNCIAPVVRADDDIASLAQRFDDSECFSVQDIGLNLFKAIISVRDSIDAYTERVKERGFSSAALVFRTPADALDGMGIGVAVDIPLTLIPLNYKIIGLGISIWEQSNSGGTYPLDDIFTISLRDMTNNNSIGTPLALSSTTKTGSVVNSGLAIGPNLYVGHMAGIRVTRASGDSGSLPNGPIFDVYIHVEPMDIITVS